MPYLPERDAALAAARTAAAFISEHAGRVGAADLRQKGVHDFVTFVDEGAQARILDRLARAFPDDAVLAEEGADAVAPQPEGRRWIVDPLDGTTNFAHGVPPYAVSIALEEDGRPVVGVVLEVSTGETFVGAAGAGVDVDGTPAAVSETDALERALLATGFPFRDYRYVEGYLASFECAIRSARGVRRHGAAAVDLAWTAAGRFDGYFEGGIAPWDVAAGVLLVREAGGIVTGLDGRADPVFSGGIVAAPAPLHGALLGVAAPLRDAFARRAGGPAAGAERG